MTQSSRPPVADADDLIPRFKRWMMNTGYDGGDANSPPKRLLAEYKSALATIESLQARVAEAEGEYARGLEDAAMVADNYTPLVDPDDDSAAYRECVAAVEEVAAEIRALAGERS